MQNSLSKPTACDVYHYAGNNPVKYTDPDGKIFGVDDVVEGVAIGALFIGITAYMATGSYQKGVNAAVGAASEGLNTVREGMNALGNKIKASFAKNTSDLPSQGNSKRQSEVTNINGSKYPWSNLPTRGKHPFDPPVDKAGNPVIKKGPSKGRLDSGGNEWIWDKSG